MGLEAGLYWETHTQARVGVFTPLGPIGPLEESLIKQLFTKMRAGKCILPKSLAFLPHCCSTFEIWRNSRRYSLRSQIKVPRSAKV